MTNPESAERALLEAARRELSPTAADVSRVLHATRASLALGHASDMHSTSEQTPRSPLSAQKLALPWRTQVIGALSIAVASGAIGYALGLRAHEPQPRIITAPSARAAEPPLSAPVPQAIETQAVTPAMPARTPLPERSASARPAHGARDTTPSSLKEEIDTMRRVDRLLHEREPRRALALLYELDRNVPNGKLLQERDAAFALARCALGLGTPAQLADEFEARYPGSVYLPRVRQQCPNDQRIPASAETHE
jgi:hypothetical protein